MKSINKKIKKVFNNKFVTLGLFPFLLIVFWFLASLLFNNKISFSVLLYKQPQTDITQLPTGKLLKGDKITGEFKAQDDYLGLLLLRFNNYTAHDFSSEDVLEFKIRQIGDKNWYYLNDYRSGLLENNLLFPLGFPVINNSKDKTYQFEIDSLLGNSSNATEISKNNEELFTGYQYPKSELLKNKKRAIVFIFEKIITSFTNTDFLLNSILYLMPFIIYMAFTLLFPLFGKVSKFRYIFSTFILFLIFVDIFIINEIYLGFLITLIFGWVCFLLINKLESKINFIFAMTLIAFWVILILLRIADFQNKINVWVYTFLVIGLLQAIIEEKKEKKISKTKTKK